MRCGIAIMLATNLRPPLGARSKTRGPPRLAMNLSYCHWCCCCCLDPPIAQTNARKPTNFKLPQISMQVLAWLLVLLCHQMALRPTKATGAAAEPQMQQMNTMPFQHRPKFRVIEANAEGAPLAEQRLALQIMILDSSGTNKSESESNKNNNNATKLREPADGEQSTVKSNHHAPKSKLELLTKLKPHNNNNKNKNKPNKFHLKRPYDFGFENTQDTTTSTTAASVVLVPSPDDLRTQFFYSLDGDGENELSPAGSDDPLQATSTTRLVPTPVAPVSANQLQQQQRTKLIRTQHRPRPESQGPASASQEQKSAITTSGGGGGSEKQQLIEKLAHALAANKRLRLRLTTTMAPTTTTTQATVAQLTTELFKLISSAHSKIDHHPPQLSTQEPPQGSSHLFYHHGDQATTLLGHHNTQRPHLLPGISTKTMPTNHSGYHYFYSTTTRPTDNNNNNNNSTSDISKQHTAPPSEATLTTRSGHLANETFPLGNGRNSTTSRVVLAPELVVRDDDDDDPDHGDEAPSQMEQSQLAPRRHLVNYTIRHATSAGERPQRPVTIVRHSPGAPGARERPPARRRATTTTTTTTSTTEAPSYVVIPHHIRLESIAATSSRPRRPAAHAGTAPPERVVVSHSFHQRPNPSVADSATSSSAGHLQLQPPPPPLPLPPPQLVRLIAKQRHKYDDNVTSPPLTVIDNDAFRLPQNTTAVHNNRLLVRIKPGARSPGPARFQVTTEYPYYNPVAGITPPYPAAPTTTRAPYTNGGGRPTSAGNYTAPVPGQPHYGYVRPPLAGDSQPPAATGLPTFGTPNIRFPAAAAAATSLVSDHLEPPQQQQRPPVVVQIPERLNVSVPSDANIVGPNNVPDRLVVVEEEQQQQGGEESANATQQHVTALSDTTIVARPPYGTQVHVSQEGIIRVPHQTTTRRPAHNRWSTTKRINIVSANTTVITANPDQLHDVLSTVIEGSHTQQHLHASRPARPASPRPGILASIGKIFNASVATTAIALMTLIKTVLIAVLVMFLPPIALAAAVMQAVSMG